MTQIATVKRLIGESQAEVLVRRQSACGHSCEACGGCGPESAAQMTAMADNTLGACPGDTVRVESESRRVLGMAGCPLPGSVPALVCGLSCGHRPTGAK